MFELYRRLWEITEPYWYAMINDEEVSDQACLEDAGEVLAVNYYLGWREAALVGMFSTELGPGALLAVACGYFTWLRWRESKKNSPSPSSSTETDSSSSAGEAA